MTSAVDLVRLAVQATGWAKVPVTGDSMRPTIAPGTHVVIARRAFADVRRGEVVAFVSGAGVVVHRVGERDAGRLLTLGDNLPLFDPPVDAAAYLGVVAGYDPPPARDPALPVRDSALPVRDLALPVHDPAPPVGQPVGGAVAHAGAPAPLTVVCAQPPDDAGAAALRALGAGVRLVTPAGRGGPAVPGTRGRRVGVSAAGALPLAALPAAIGPPAAPGYLLVGFRYGPCHPSAARQLSPDAVDQHVRPAAPLQELSVGETLCAIADVLRPVLAGCLETASR